MNYNRIEPLFLFDFFQLKEHIKILPLLRTSIWRERDSSFLMPRQFEKCEKCDHHFKIELMMIEPDRFLSKDYIGKKFFFGSLHQIIGYGILMRIQS
jgi:hypothetical protein